MLIDKGLSTGEIVTIKLTSGEELIARLIEESNDYYKVSKPMVVATTPKGLGLMPYAITVDLDKDLKLSKNNINIIDLTNKDFTNQYIELTTNLKLV